MSINVELLERVLAHIEAHPEAWVQGEYATRDPEELPEGNACGTAFCFAGWTCVLAGRVIKWEDDPIDSTDTVPSHTSQTADGSIPGTAAELLGINRLKHDRHTPAHKGFALFNAYNTLDDLRAIISDLVASADLPDEVAADV